MTAYMLPNKLPPNVPNNMPKKIASFSIVSQARFISKPDYYKIWLFSWYLSFFSIFYDFYLLLQLILLPLIQLVSRILLADVLRTFFINGKTIHCSWWVNSKTWQGFKMCLLINNKLMWKINPIIRTTNHTW